MFLRFLTFFYFQNVFFIFKKRWQSSEGKQINKKHFQNNSNEIPMKLNKFINNRILYRLIRM